ncbi:head fiber protein, partial [Enterobacter hormaechei]
LTPYVLPAATTTTLGGVKKAAHVDPASGTVADVVNALIDAGIMA